MWVWCPATVTKWFCVWFYRAFGLPRTAGSNTDGAVLIVILRLRTNLSFKFYSISILRPRPHWCIYSWKAVSIWGVSIFRPHQSGVSYYQTRSVWKLQSKCEELKCFTCWGGDKKNVSGSGKVFKKIDNFKKSVVTPTFVCYEIDAASLFNTWLVSGCEQMVFRLYFSWTRGRLSETLKAQLERFCY